MGRILTSPSRKFAGTVVLAEPILFPAYMAWKQAIDNAAEIRSQFTIAETGFDDRITQAMLPGILAVVEEWHIEGVPERPSADTFPMTPRLEMAQLLAVITSKVVQIIGGVDEVPPA